MPFHFQTFKTRALTATVFAVVMLVGLLWNHWTFFLLFSVIHFGCWHEYQKLMAKINSEYQAIPALHKYGVMITGWAFMLFMCGNGYSIGNIRLHDAGTLLLLLCGILLPLMLVVVRKNFSVKAFQYSLGGLLYISLSLGLMLNIRSSGIIAQGSFVFEDRGWIIPVVLISSIWVNDTMAYVVGSFVGKTPFSRISPKKTWEGTVGGALLCIAVVSFAGYKMYPQLGLVSYIIISSVAAVVGTAGDLLESKLKRMAKVKDSGHIMPGHGGFLDRFDSLLLATPFVWVYVFLLTLILQ